MAALRLLWAGLGYNVDNRRIADCCPRPREVRETFLCGRRCVFAASAARCLLRLVCIQFLFRRPLVERNALL